MNLPPKDYTQQETLIAQVLDDLGLRYEQQFQIDINLRYQNYTGVIYYTKV